MRKKIRGIRKYCTSPAQEDDGLPLEDDELVGVLSLKLVDEFDEVAVTMLAKVLGYNLRQLILRLDVVDANLVILHQLLLHKEISQRDVLCARTVDAVAGDMQCRRAAYVQRHAAEALAKAQLQHHVGARHRFLRCQSYRHEFCLHSGLYGGLLQSNLEADLGVGQHHDV